MSSSAFINALRRFISRHGNVKILRSDQGTNFVGATRELGLNTINVEDPRIMDLLRNNGASWVFNPPHASHMGGVWERMIGIVRRILNSILMNISGDLTHDVLITLLAEVCAIVNARPIVPVSSDSDIPDVLSPSSILTQKVDFTVEHSNLSLKDIYKEQWKRVQLLANRFWKRWQSNYLQLLQPRRKWQTNQSDLKEGDVVLLKDSEVTRNQWPHGVVEKVFSSLDEKVRKVSVRVRRDGNNVVLKRPISELILLLGDE